MRRLALPLLALLLPTTTLLPLAACDDGDASNATGLPDGGAAGFEASTSVPTDAAPPVVDASATDSAAPRVDAVTVLVTLRGAPVADVTVVLHDGAGAVVTSVKSGADGKAVLPTTTPGQVTVAFETPVHHLVTYLGAKPGDVLEAAAPDSRNVRVSYPVAPNGAQPPSIVAGNFSCSNNSIGTSALVFLTNECITGTTFPVIALTYVNGTAWYTHKKDITPAATGETAVTLGAWAVSAPFDFSVTNAPAGTFRGWLGQVANGQSIAVAPASQMILANGAGSGTFGVASGYADGLQPEAQVTTSQGSFLRGRAIAKRIDKTATSLAMDLATAFLPELQTVTLDRSTADRPKATWTAADSLAVADSGVVELRWQGGSWTFVVPPATTSVTAPALPAALATWLPLPAAIVEPFVGFFESDLVPGYDAVRAKAASFGFTRVPDISFGGVTPGLPANGTVRISVLMTNPG